jgi:hypothetical protein
MGRPSGRPFRFGARSVEKEGSKKENRRRTQMGIPTRRRRAISLSAFIPSDLRSSAILFFLLRVSACEKVSLSQVSANN